MLKKINFLTCADIPEMVLTTAHFNLLLKKISCKGGKIESISKNSEEEIYEIRAPANIKTYEYIKTIWKSNEEMINESINTILLALSPHALGSIVSKLLNKEINRPLSLVKLEWDKEILSVNGDPDIILCDEEEKYIFLIELKIQAKKSNGKYSLQQHIKYSNLIQRLQSEGKIVDAALLAPNQDVKKVVVKKEMNWFDYSDNSLIPIVANIDSNLTNTPKHVSDYKKYIKYQLDEINKYDLDISPEKYSHLKYISFTKFKEALSEVAPHLTKAFSSIEKYSSM